MQAMIQMGYQEQIPMAALFPVQNEKKSNCTPHRPKARFHVRYYDFVEICKDDGASADVLRYFEIRTDWLIDELRRTYRMAEGHIPDAEDLWLSASYRDISDGICHAQSHTTCGGRIEGLIALDFLERRFVARATPDVEERPTVAFYEDRDGSAFIVVDDEWGNYISGNGEPRNAVCEGYVVEWQYRYCIDKVNAALAGAFLDPPQSAKRWPPITRRRDPVQKNSASAPTDCDPHGASDAPTNDQLSSQPSAQGGTLNADVCQEGGHFHDTVDTKDVSTIRHDIVTNVSENSAISNVAEFRNAPWSPETLVELARARHRPGLFEVHGDDEDYEAAEKLIGETSALGLRDRYAWAAIDRHICAMMDGPTWYARERKGKTKTFGLVHVFRNWAAVAQSLEKEPWWPLDPVPYEGPPDEEDYIDYEDPAQSLPLIDDAMDDPAGEANEAQDEATEPPVEAPQPRIVTGTLQSYAESLLDHILELHPLLQAYIVNVGPRKWVVRVETPGGPVDFDRTSGWYSPPPEVKDLIEQAVAAQRGGDGYGGYRSLAYDQTAWHEPGGVRQPDRRDHAEVPVDCL